MEEASPWGAIAGFAGDIVSGLFGNHQQKKQHQYDIEMANLQHQQAKEKMQSAYQWSVEDMKKAGLNPTLMYQSAASPVMSGGSGGNSSQLSNPGAAFENLGNIVNSALSIQKQNEATDAAIQETEAKTENIQHMTGKTDQEIQNLKTERQIKQDIAKADIALKGTQKANEKAMIAKNLAQTIQTQLESQYIKRYGHSPDANWSTRLAGQLERIAPSEIIHRAMQISQRMLMDMNEPDEKKAFRSMMKDMYSLRD